MKKEFALATATAVTTLLFLNSRGTVPIYMIY